MKGSWFKKGYKAVAERSAELEANREKGGRKFLLSCQVGDGESATLRFVTVEPITIREHYLPNVKGPRYQTCLEGTGEDCPMCAMGNKASFRGAYLVIDRRTDEWTDGEGKKHTKANQIKMFKQGIKLLKVLEQVHNKRDLSSRDVEITRTGGGTDTAYNVVPEDVSPLSEEDKKTIDETLAAFEVATLEDLIIREIQPKTRKEITDLLMGGSSPAEEQVRF